MTLEDTGGWRRVQVGVDGMGASREGGLHSGRAMAVRALIAAATVLVVGGVVVVWMLKAEAPSGHVAISRQRAVPSAVTVESARMVGLAVASVTGPVELRRDGSVTWAAVRPGETIGLRDALRTGTGGAAVLELDDHTTIWMWPESEVAAERLDSALARVGVEGGRLDLSVPDGPRRVEVIARGGATAATQGARFSVIVDGAHVATVATRAGNVDVVSGNGQVRVPPGMQATAIPGTPTVLSPIPRELLLSVDWPGRVINTHTAVIRGRAPAGVLVSVDGARVVVDQHGTFTRDLWLSEGTHDVQVTADDAAGHRAIRQGALRVDTHPPRMQTRGNFE